MGYPALRISDPNESLLIVIVAHSCGVNMWVWVGKLEREVRRPYS